MNEKFVTLSTLHTIETGETIVVGLLIPARRIIELNLHTSKIIIMDPVTNQNNYYTLAVESVPALCRQLERF